MKRAAAAVLLVVGALLALALALVAAVMHRPVPPSQVATDYCEMAESIEQCGAPTDPTAPAYMRCVEAAVGQAQRITRGIPPQCRGGGT